MTRWNRALVTGASSGIGLAIAEQLAAVVVGDLGGVEQRLGRDAAPVEANTAEILTFNNRDFQPKLRRADGGNIATGAGTENDEVVIRHVTPPSPKAFLPIP